MPIYFFRESILSEYLAMLSRIPLPIISFTSLDEFGAVFLCFGQKTDYRGSYVYFICLYSVVFYKLLDEF